MHSSTEFKKGHHSSTEFKKGYKLSEKTKERMRKNRKGMLGKHHTDKTKKKLSDFYKGKAGFFKGKHHTEATKRKLREATIKYLASGGMKNKETLIEIIMETELKRKSIYYEKQVPLCKICIADFYLPQNRIVIFCDGDYWHNLSGRKDKDINQDFVLTFNGFNVYRFTETEIKKSVKKCLRRVKWLLH